LLLNADSRFEVLGFSASNVEIFRSLRMQDSSATLGFEIDAGGVTPIEAMTGSGLTGTPQGVFLDGILELALARIIH